MKTDWEALYQAGDTRWDKGEPSPGLVDYLKNNPDLKKGRVLVPGCGAGHDAREWERHGFDVTGVDIAAGAIERCSQHQPSGSGKISYQKGDFLTDSPAEHFDYVFEHTFYCAISPSQRGIYLESLQRWLKPEGRFIAVHYFITDEDGPPFGTTRDEVKERFSPCFELIDDWVPRSYPNRTNLERMFSWARRSHKH